MDLKISKIVDGKWQSRYINHVLNYKIEGDQLLLTDINTKEKRVEKFNPEEEHVVKLVYTCIYRPKEK
jgi:hypothetical protein